MASRFMFVCILSSLALAGCASKPPSKMQAMPTAFAPVAQKPIMLGRDEYSVADGTLQNPPFASFDDAPDAPNIGPKNGNDSEAGESLAGRTLTVASISDIKLRDKEVVLTFDDGPMPKKTDKVLAILDRYGVKATFLMVGQMASNYPAVAKRVVARGHSIGAHTFNHSNLAKDDYQRALSDISAGNAAVAKATGVDVGFFRFPYLADTSALRRIITNKGMVILDVDIDTKDYFKSSPAAIVARTMAQLRARRKGIILMHDIHNRTIAMLPDLLADLKAGGYKVVALKYSRTRPPAALVSAKIGDSSQSQQSQMNSQSQNEPSESNEPDVNPTAPQLLLNAQKDAVTL